MDIRAVSNFRLLEVDDLLSDMIGMDFRLLEFFFLVLLFLYRSYHLNFCNLKPETPKTPKHEIFNIISGFN